MSTPVDDNGHPMLASSFSRKNPNRQYSIKTESGLSRASTATTSSNSSTNSSIRYPSDSTNLTGFSIEQYLSNTPLPPPPSQQKQYHSLPNNNNNSNNMELSDDHFDIIDSLNYDDVDDGLIDHEMVHRRRETLVHQLLTSEQAYFESLQVISNVFIEPLKKDAKQSSFSFLGMKKMICTERETRWLFGNFEEILHVHHEILISLEERLRIWGPTQIISDVFQSWFARMGAYKAYLDNYSTAVTTYERLTRYQPFKKFIDNAHKDAQLKGATLLALLQTPAGCIGRYVQLMTRIADATSPMHPDYVQLLQCKQRMVSIAEEMKAKIDDADNVDQVLMIHQALIGAPFGVKAQRRLVLQSSMSISGEERIYILFSDILVFVRPKQDGNRTLLQFKGMVPLERARLKPVHPNIIEITSPFQGVDTLNTTFVASSQAHVLQAENQEDRDRWMERLQKVIANLDRASAKSANKRRVVQARSKDSRSSTSSDRT